MTKKFFFSFFVKQVLLIIFVNTLFIEKSIGQENTSTLCMNGIDDDGDGLIDCDDPECVCIDCFETPQLYTGINSQWLVSDILFEEIDTVALSNFPLPNDPSINWNQAAIVDQLCFGWVDPQQLPSPINQAKWISHPDDQNCTGSSLNTYYFYQTIVSLPCSCDGQPIFIDSTYAITVDAYGDNEILAVYVNDQIQNVAELPGGSFGLGGQVQIELNSSWKPFENTITFLVHNYYWTTSENPEGFLCVLSQNGDSDNDGISDYLDLCLCENHSIVDTNFISLTTSNIVDTGTVITTHLTDYGCDSTTVVNTIYEPVTSISELIDKDQQIYAPNAFSPNADGFNDYFTIYAEPNVLDILYLRIFNRQGKLVFNRVNFEPNNPLLGWDGTFDNTYLQPTGVYLFEAEVKWKNGKTKLLVGDIAIIK